MATDVFDILKQVWHEWKIANRIGGGAYGTVYEAVRKDYDVESRAAIKIISVPKNQAEIDTLRTEGMTPETSKTYLQGVVNDFVNEIRLMISLEGSPNIVDVKDYRVVEKTDELGWNIFIRMELLTPFHVYTCDRKLSELDVIKLGCDICTALETCAKQNIIHRDIKPGNILVHKNGDFKLGDFGIARKLENMTGGLSQKYTPKYMAPEVAISPNYDSQVDIYSLGIVLYEQLNKGCIPFQAEKQISTPSDIENAIRRRNTGESLPAPCDASPAMADLILRACAYDPNMRFASATEMKQALLSVANGTYQIGVSNLDMTTSVRKVADSYDKTTSVRKAPDASNQESASAVNTFGSELKKKGKMLAVIASVLAVLIVSVGIFSVPKSLDENDSTDPNETLSETTSETGDYHDLDAQQIASIISEADALAAEENYEGALAKVQEELVIYPKSKELQTKSEEYTSALNAQVKTDALTEAETLAQVGDYLGAFNMVDQAISTIGEDEELSSSAKEYEDAYVVNVVTQVDTHLENGDFDAAETLVSEAMIHFPNNEMLRSEAETIENSRPHVIGNEQPPEVTNPVEEETPGVSLTDDPTKQSSYIFDFVNVTSADLGKGDLVLVNNNIKFLGTITEDDLVVVREMKNQAYSVKDYTVLVRPQAMDALNTMLLDFYNATGNDNIMVRSGHRTLEYQQGLYDDELAATGAVSSSLVAMPGYSEHHTGLAVDFTTYDGEYYTDFDGTGDYEWIMNNCWRYGFVNRYPAGKEALTFIDNEPWHFRYVGIPHAEIMKDYDFCLEEYISFIKNYTIDTSFLLKELDNGARYIIYYVPLTDSESTAIYIPLMPDGVTPYPYEISGNNVDGFIVTVTLDEGTQSAGVQTPAAPDAEDAQTE